MEELPIALFPLICGFQEITVRLYNFSSWIPLMFLYWDFLGSKNTTPLLTGPRVQSWVGVSSAIPISSKQPSLRRPPLGLSQASDFFAVPAEYHDLLEVFSKARATSLPPHCPYNCATDLLSGTASWSVIFPIRPGDQGHGGVY